MKIIASAILALSFYTLSISANSSALGAERYKVFEFGESGHQLSFPMTKKEIEQEDARISRLKRLNEVKGKKAEKWVQVYEFGESGHTVEFPMTKKEIEEAQILRKRLKRSSAKRFNNDVETIETAEGHIITFAK